MNHINDGHASIDDVLVKVKRSLHRAFSQVDDVMTPCSIHAWLITSQISKFRHMMTLVHFDEAIIDLMQLSLVISHCNITFSVF